MDYRTEGHIRDSHFPRAIFFTTFGIMLLLSGLHVGIILLVNAIHMAAVWQVVFVVTYWIAVSLGFTRIVSWQLDVAYEKPLKKVADAAGKVAHGDFSVYVPTIHTVGRYDYLDQMIVDFNRMVEELGSIETLKTDFVSTVSHEIKTPIALIKNYAEMIRQEGVSEEQQKEYAAGIEEAATRLSNLISSILKLNKLEHQSILAQPSVYDVSRQLETCILQFERMWDEKDMDLTVEIEERSFVLADQGLMELVWNNLISNALKFTPDHGRISILQSKTKENVLVAVEDSGCGMDDDTRRHIFDKFYQGDTSHATEGNGLGLALVIRVLQLNDGDITVESEPGKGSKFTVTLPIHSAESAQGRNENGDE